MPQEYEDEKYGSPAKDSSGERKSSEPPDEIQYSVGAHRSGEIVISDSVDGIPGTISVHNGGLSRDELRELISKHADHRDGRLFVPGVAEARTDLDAMKALAMFNSRLHEAHDPEGAKKLYDSARREGIVTRDEDINPDQKWQILAIEKRRPADPAKDQNQLRAKDLADQYKAREAAPGRDAKDHDRER